MEEQRDDRRKEEEIGTDPTAVEGPAAEWPYASLMVLGFFGTDTPAGRRLLRRSTAGIIVVVLSTLLLLRAEQLGLDVVLAVGAIGLPAGVAGIGWAYARYLSELDELSRVIQLKAFAFSYGAVMTIAAALLAPALALSDGSVTMTAAGTLPWLVWAEGFRGLALVVLARRYR